MASFFCYLGNASIMLRWQLMYKSECSDYIMLANALVKNLVVYRYGEECINRIDLQMKLIFLESYSLQFESLLRWVQRAPNLMPINSKCIFLWLISLPWSRYRPRRALKITLKMESGKHRATVDTANSLQEMTYI